RAITKLSEAFQPLREAGGGRGRGGERWGGPGDSFPQNGLGPVPSALPPRAGEGGGAVWALGSRADLLRTRAGSPGHVEIRPRLRNSAAGPSSAFLCESGRCIGRAVLGGAESGVPAGASGGRSWVGDGVRGPGRCIGRAVLGGGRSQGSRQVYQAAGGAGRESGVPAGGLGRSLGPWGRSQGLLPRQVRGTLRLGPRGAWDGPHSGRRLFLCPQLGGCGILGVGIWLAVTQGNFATLSPSFPSLSAANLLIVTGTFVMVIGFVGCIGAIKENKCLLLSFFIMLLIVFLLELTVAILFFVYTDQIDTYAQRDLKKGLHLYGTEGNIGLTNAWSIIQTDFRCCGVSNYTDWFEVYNSTRVPDSCCLEFSESCGLHSPGTWWKAPCYETVKIWLQENLLAVGIFGLCTALVQILGLTFAMTMYCQVVKADTYCA
uniref:Tetraspanin-4 n=2 Tax=Sarcophilus harrisii TaxID=9305 RepID=A0A7N4V6W6_SARHA